MREMVGLAWILLPSHFLANKCHTESKFTPYLSKWCGHLARLRRGDEKQAGSERQNFGLNKPQI